MLSETRIIFGGYEARLFADNFMKAPHTFYESLPNRVIDNLQDIKSCGLLFCLQKTRKNVYRKQEKTFTENAII